MFVIWRAVTGAGFAGIIGGFFTILVDILPLRQQTFYCDPLGGVESVTILAAPILGGALTQFPGSPWCFWISLPSGGITLLMTILLFSDPKSSDISMALKQILVELDLLSILFFNPALTSLFIALSWAGTKYTWDDALPPRIKKNRNVIFGTIFTMSTNSAMDVIEYYLSIYHQVVHEYSLSESGYIMIPIVVRSTHPTIPRAVAS